MLLGDSGVGKTCLVTRFVRGDFEADSKVTVGVRSRRGRRSAPLSCAACAAVLRRARSRLEVLRLRARQARHGTAAASERAARLVRRSLRLRLRRPQAAFCAQTVALPELGTSVKFEIWDTAGQERYASLAPLYYRGAAAAAVVFDVTSADTFSKAHAWVRELKKHAAVGCVISLVGNKTDLSEREVSREAAASYAQQHGLAYIETSAKEATGVDGPSGLFPLIARLCSEAVQGGGAGAAAA